MVRAGLGAGWACLLANDIDAKKAAAYRANWGGRAFRQADIHTLRAADLPGRADLMWGSFPCQDLSLAGRGRGLAGARSGAFHGFAGLIETLRAAGRAPKLVVVENVVGLLTANRGADFATVCGRLAELGYWFGALTMDGAHFTPQSRPRLFLIAVRDAPPAALVSDAPAAPWTSPALQRAVSALPAADRARAVWWRAPPPPARNTRLADLLEPDETVVWRAPEETARWLALMAPAQRARIAAFGAAGGRHVGALYRRMRRDAAGARVQRVEARFDGVAGCLRTPAGGSSRQSVIVVEAGGARTRLLTGRECARLMGLPDSYRLPPRLTDALHLTGDGVVAPLVRFLSAALLEPLAAR